MPGVKGLGKLACELGVYPQVAYVALNRPRDRQQWEHGDLHLTWILFLNQSMAFFFSFSVPQPWWPFESDRAVHMCGEKRVHREAGSRCPLADSQLEEDTSASKAIPGDRASS